MAVSAQIMRRRDPDRNMACFHTVALQADLLDGWAVVREWGRIGQPGRVTAERHPDLGGAQASAERVATQGRRLSMITRTALQIRSDRNRTTHLRTICAAPSPSQHRSST
jgi:predicted DNA-binding WGR domain protein